MYYVLSPATEYIAIRLIKSSSPFSSISRWTKDSHHFNTISLDLNINCILIVALFPHSSTIILFRYPLSFLYSPTHIRSSYFQFVFCWRLCMWWDHTIQLHHCKLGAVDCCISIANQTISIARIMDVCICECKMRNIEILEMGDISIIKTETNNLRPFDCNN